MKSYSAAIIGIILIAFSSCGTSNNSTEEGNLYTGTIEPTGITTYQYGTHTLQAEDEFYALRSDSVDLSEYEGKQVTIRATKVEGYPVDGGPIYLNVTQVNK